MKKKERALTARKFVELCKPTDNIYESIMVIAKRAKQITVRNKEEISEKLATFVLLPDNLEDVTENREQITISKFYEKQPKPTLLATEEFLEDKILHRYADDEAA